MNTPKRKRQFVWEATPGGKYEALWCDEKYMEAIRAMNGVSELHAYAHHCLVAFNLCYDKKEVMAAIEAIITGATDAQA